MSSISNTEPKPQGFILVEDGQDGIQTSFYLSRSGAETALIEMGLGYTAGGEAFFTKEQLEEHVRLMREAEERQEWYVIEAMSMTSFWINVVDINA